MPSSPDHVQPAPDSLRCVVVTADQRSSRTTPDAVPALIDALTGVRTALPFVRTAGDEVQGLLTDAEAAAEVLEILLRSAQWHVGVGLGSAETPLPDDTRAARGSAFVAARKAVESAGSGTGRAHVAPGTHEDVPLAAATEAALWLWQSLLEQRSAKGWEVVDLLGQGLTQREAAERLGIGQTAVTQRASAARLHEGVRARELVTQLFTWHLEAPAHHR